MFNLGGRTIFARQVTIPARPFLGLDRDDEIEIEAIAGNWLLGERQMIFEDNARRVYPRLDSLLRSQGR